MVERSGLFLDIMKENEVLARFHGWRHSPTPKGKGAGLWYFPEWNKAAFKSTCFLYDKSWDWLMPVVEKIESMGCIVEITLCLGKVCKIRKVISKTQDWQTCHESNSTIEAVFKACVEFIEWYNANKQL